VSPVASRALRLKQVNGANCIAYEYAAQDKDINIAVIELSGRYPETGRAFNESIKEICFVQSGSGIVSIDGAEHTLGEGDVVLILPGQKFFWDGKMTFVIACTPAWNAGQYRHEP